MTPPTTASAAKQPHPIATVLFIKSIRNGPSQYHYYPKSGAQVSCPQKLVQKFGCDTRRLVPLMRVNLLEAVPSCRVRKRIGLMGHMGFIWIVPDVRFIGP